MFLYKKTRYPLQGLGGKVEIQLFGSKSFPSSLRQVDRFWKEIAKETCNFVGNVTLKQKFTTLDFAQNQSKCRP